MFIGIKHNAAYLTTGGSVLNICTVYTQHVMTDVNNQPVFGMLVTGKYKQQWLTMQEYNNKHKTESQVAVRSKKKIENDIPFLTFFFWDQ